MRDGKTVVEGEHDESTAGSVVVPSSRVRAALQEVVHLNLPDWLVFAAIMTLLLSARVAFESEGGWLTETWWLVVVAALFGAAGVAMRSRRMLVERAYLVAVVVALAWIAVGAVFLYRHTSLVDGLVLLLTMPALGFLLLEVWSFGMALALAAVVWSGAVSRGVEGREWAEFQVLVLVAIVVAGFVHVTRTRTLVRLTHFRVRERQRRDRLKAMFDSADRRREELAELSIRDPLTGAYNRRYLSRVRDDLERPTASWGCVMFDLDNFKEVNDRYGHDEGDRVLQAFAYFLRRTGRAGDQLMRYGGDEFVMFVDVRSDRGLDIVADRLESVGGEESPAAFSIGRAFRRPRESMLDVISRADSDLKMSKSGVNGLEQHRRLKRARKRP